MDDLTRFRTEVTAWVMSNDRGSTPADVKALADGITTVVLVEGESDRVAIDALADMLGRDLTAERVVVVPMHGAMNIRNYVERFGPHGLGLPLAGLCDAGEDGFFRRALQDSGLGAELTRDSSESLGFFVCDADLEAELIRALGTDGVERVMADQGDLRAFRTFQNQPAQRGRPADAQQRDVVGRVVVCGALLSR
jgi:hypothetical protein